MRDKSRAALTAILLLGLVSLLGDVIYEGGRAVVPSYLGYIGASTVAVGLIFGASEFLGLALRLVSGIIADLTRSYWLLYFLGYALLISIPLIGLSDDVRIIATLLLLERMAKAIRSPARDVLLSMASEGFGAGKAFGLHELLDQVGALIGPIFLGILLLSSSESYSTALLSLLVPYFLMMLAVFSAILSLRARVRGVRFEGDGEGPRLSTGSLTRPFWTYSLSVALLASSLIHVSLLVLRASTVFASWGATLLFALAQALDAISAPLAGLAYDRVGRRILFFPVPLIPLIALLSLVGDVSALILSFSLFGIVYGIFESVFRASVREFVDDRSLGTAYGVFNLLFGLGTLASGAIYGYILALDSVSLGLAASVALALMGAILLRISMRSDPYSQLL